VQEFIMLKLGVFLCSIGLMLGSATAHASVYVFWQANGGFYYQNGDPLLQPGESALAQLIWSADNIANSAMSGAANYVSGNDVWLANYTITYAGNTEWGTFSTLTSSSSVSGGYIYARVFTTLTPDVGDWYYVGRVETALEKDINEVPTPSPQTYVVNRDWDPVGGDGAGLGDIVDFGPYAFQVVPVPEPGTIALFALGVATLAASRRRRKTEVVA